MLTSRQKRLEALYAPLYAPLPDSSKYLERIGLGPVGKADRQTLDALIMAHQMSVPFENLDIYDANTDISLNIPALYDKIVLRRRGGYCFELNAAFMALLESLGYDCYAVSVRVVEDVTLCVPASHRATIVTIGDAQYFCDVGYGGPSPRSSLDLGDPGEQASGSHTFLIERLENCTMLAKLVKGKKRRTLSFHEAPCDPVDFLPLSEYQSKSRNSSFTSTRVCNLLSKSGSITLSDKTLKIHSGGRTAVTELCSESGLRGALKEYYGIEVDFPLRM